MSEWVKRWVGEWLNKWVLVACKEDPQQTAWGMRSGGASHRVSCALGWLLFLRNFILCMFKNSSVRLITENH